MAYRTKMTKKASRKSFRRTASRTNRKNITSARPKRGGYRL